MARKTLLEKLAGELKAECPNDVVVDFVGEGVDAKMVVTLTEKYKREFEGKIG